MRNKPRILLSLAPSNPSTYARAVEAAGGVPVGGYLPDVALLHRCDGLLLGGGGDVDPPGTARRIGAATRWTGSGTS